MLALTRWLAALGLAWFASTALLRSLDLSEADSTLHDVGENDGLRAVLA